MPNIIRMINRRILTGSAIILVLTAAAILITQSRSQYNIKLLKSDSGWGYDILAENELFIHQPFMPVVEGNVAFPDRNAARKTGKLMVRKLKKNQSPTITREELNHILR